MAAQEGDLSNIDVSKLIEDLQKTHQRQFRLNYSTQIQNCVKEQERQKVHNFFLDVNKRLLDFKLPKDEVNEIRDAVDELVDRLLVNLGEANPAFEISHKYAVGSMAEGTRLDEPNEFDFVAVLKRWSQPGALRLEQVLDANNFSPFDLISSLEHVSVKFMNSTDNYVLPRIGGYWGYKEYEKGMFERAYTKFIDTVVEKRTGTLSVESKIKLNGPAYCLSFNWKNPTAPVKDMTISIDVALAIEIEGVPSSIQEKDVFHPQYYEKLNQVNRYLLIPTYKCYCEQPSRFGPRELSCYRLTFTNTEVQLVKLLSDNHKLCIRILKYLFSKSNIGTLSSSVVSSYLLKTCVLMHAVSCCNNSDTFQCIVDILCILLDCFIYSKTLDTDCVKLPCIFFNSALVTQTFMNSKMYAVVRKYIFDIIKELLKISQSKSYSFEECASELRKLAPNAGS